MRSRHHGRAAVERRGSPFLLVVVGPDLPEIDAYRGKPDQGQSCTCVGLQSEP